MKFRLNGIHFDREELKEVAYGYIKEGLDYQQDTGNFLLDWLNDKPSLEVYTSGTTSAPKKIVLQKQHMINAVLTSGDFFRLSEGNSALHCLPAKFIAGKMMLVRAMILGLAIDMISPSGNPLKATKKNYDFCAMTPLQAQNTLGQLHRIKKLIIGGAPVSKELIDALQEKAVGVYVYETYGMTETITHIAAKQLNNPNGKTIATPYFKVLPHISISQDSRHCLVIEAPRISDTSVITNDVVKIISEHEFEWVGRWDHIINSGGIKLIPEQVEAKLVPVIPNRFFVAGIPDKVLGERLVLIVEEAYIDKKNLMQRIKTLRSIHKFEIPKAIYNLPAFVETETGKIMRLQTLQKVM